MDYTERTRICRLCGKQKDTREFYKSPRWECKECVRARSREAYRTRTTERIKNPTGTFRCRDCRKKLANTEMSSGVQDVCRPCRRKRLLEKHAQAPDILVCHCCGRVKLKAEFTKYSKALCKACARIKARRYRNGE